MPPRYGRLEIGITADTRGMEVAIRSAATRSGAEAARGIGQEVSKGVGGLKGVLGGIGKAAAVGLAGATVAATGFGVAAFKTAARAGEMDATLRALAKANGLSYDSMLKNVGQIRKQGIEAGTAQSVVAEFAKNQLDLGKSTDLATVAQDAAVISGKNSTETLDALIHGITTQNSLVLRNAGIQVDATQAQTAYAKQLGKTRAELTPAEKSQALLNAVLEKGGSVAGAYSAAMEEPGKVLRSFPRLFDDIRLSIGQGLVKGFGPLILKTYDLTKAFSHMLAPGGKLAPVMGAIGDVATKIAAPVGRLIDKVTAWVKGLDAAKVKGFADGLKQWGPMLAGAAAGVTALVSPSVLGKIPILGSGVQNVGLALVKSLVPGLTGAGGAMKSMTGPFGVVLGLFALLMAVSPEFRAAVMEIGKALLGVLSKALTQILAAVKPLIPPIIKLAAAIGGGLAKVLLALLPVLVTLLPVLVELAVGVLIPLVPVITALANALAVVAGWLGPLAPVIVAMVVAWAAYQAVTAAVAIATGIMSAIQLGQAAASVTATAAQWLLNAAMSANPVMLVVLALAALVGGLIIAYQKVDWFRSICDTIGRFFLSVFKPAFDAVSGAIAALWHWITGNSPGLIPAFQLLMVILGPVASFLAGVVAGAFRVVQAAVAAVFSWIAGNWPLLLGIITGPIGLAVMLVIQHWATLRAAVAAAVAFVRAVVSAGWSWAVAFTRATWSALSGAVAAALGAIRSAVAAALGAVRGLLSAAWSWARDTTAQMWAAISTVIRGAWDTIKGTVGEAGQWVITKLQWVWDQVKAAASNAWNGIVAVIRTAWDKVQNVVAEPARFVAFKIINPLVKGVNALVTKVGIPAIPEIPKFAEGGRIPGGWGGGDRQLILAEPGEWMLTKRQARAIGYGRLRGLPRYAEGGEIGHPSHGPQLRGPFDWLGDLGSKAMRISHVGDLLKLGGDVVDTFSGMLKWAAAQAFKAATEPLRKLAKPYADERVPPGNVMKQYLGKLAIDIIDKAIEFIESKSASECEAGGVVAHAMQFDGKPYRWGGPANPSQGFDCSSFVSFIAGSAGLPLPGGFKVPASSHGPITNDYLSFGRLKTIGRDAAQPGDIAVNTKHIGFIIGPGGAGFAARSTATGIGKQSFASGYTYRTWGGGEGSGTCEGGTGPDGPPNGFPAGVKHYAGLVARIAAQLGVGFATNAFLSQMQSESGGNPRAINNWDSNAKKGTPSKGLMQVIDPTFLAYAGPHKSKGIWNPEANIYAAINYAKSRYGSRLLSVIGRGHGYARGGIIPEHVVGVGQVSGEIYHIGEAGPEMVSPLSGRSAAPDAGPFTRDRGGTVINVYPREGQSEEAIAAAVSRRLAWAEAGGRG